MRAWWAQLRAGAAALRGPLVVGAVVLAFVLGGVAAEADNEDQPRVVHVEAIPAPSLDRLVAALDANTEARTPAPPTVTSTAESLVDAVESGDVVVVPEATPVSPAPTPSTIATTTTTTVATTTTTDPVIRFEPHDP